MTSAVFRRLAGLAVVLAVLSGCSGTPDAAEPPTASTVGPATSGGPATAGSETGGSETAGSESSVPETTAPATPAGPAICAHSEQIAEDLPIIEVEEVADPAGFPARVAAIVERFASIEPPAEIAQSWQLLRQFFELVDDALQGVKIETQEDLDEALKLEGQDAFVLAIMAPGQAEAVGVYLQQNCGAELGLTPPAVPDACAVLDPVHLGSLFDKVPEGAPVRWANAITECDWNADDHGVGLVIGPAEVLRRDVLDQASLLTTSAGVVDVEVYDGAIGPFHLSAGRSAFGEVDGIGILVWIDMDDPDIEQNKAIALVNLVADDIA